MATRPRLKSKAPLSRDEGPVTTRFLGDEEKPSASSQKETASRPHRWRRMFHDTWLPEVLGIIISASCLIALAAVLFAFDGQSSPQLRWGLTLNAVISILATASRTALLAVVAATIGQLKWCWFTASKRLQDMQSFDNASRGALGSVTMLLSMPAGYLASLGAAVTILALAWDPFLQQIVNYPIRGYIGAINAGIWSNASQFDFTPTCPSGNCTWPVFQSVGWCSKCVNATETAVIDENCNATVHSVQTGPVAGNDTNKTCTLGFGSGQGSNVTIFGRTSNESDTYVLYNDVVWAIYSPEYPDLVNTTGEQEPMATATYAGVTNPLLVVGRATLNTYSDGNVPWFSSIQVSAAEQCVLTPCLRDYAVTTTGGIPAVNVDHIDYESVEYRYNNVTGSEGFFYANPVTMCWQADAGDVDYTTVGSCPDESTECFEQGNTTRPGFCPVDIYPEALIDRLTGSAATPLAYANGSFNLDGDTDTVSDTMTVIQANTLGTVLNNVAASLTQLGLQVSNGTATGKVTTMQVYVLVKWEWLILPTVLELAGIALLLATALLSSHRKVDLWKTSIMALFYHGLEERTLRDTDIARDTSGMRLSARKTVVKLAVSDEDDRLMLREVLGDADGYTKVVASDGDAEMTHDHEAGNAVSQSDETERLS